MAEGIDQAGQPIAQNWVAGSALTAAPAASAFRVAASTSSTNRKISTVVPPGFVGAFLSALMFLVMQGMLEFGPLWLVAPLVPPFLHGPHWAGLTSAFGLGALLESRAWFTRAWTVRGLAVALVACSAVLVVSDHAGVVVGVQVALTARPSPSCPPGDRPLSSSTGSRATARCPGRFVMRV